MSYWQLKSYADDQRAWAQQYYALPPTACPNDGSVLDIGYRTQPGGGKLQYRHCPMGDFVYTGGRRLTAFLPLPFLVSPLGFQRAAAAHTLARMFVQVIAAEWMALFAVSLIVMWLSTRHVNTERAQPFHALRRSIAILQPQAFAATTGTVWRYVGVFIRKRVAAQAERAVGGFAAARSELCLSPTSLVVAIRDILRRRRQPQMTVAIGHFIANRIRTGIIVSHTCRNVTTMPDGRGFIRRSAGSNLPRNAMRENASTTDLQGSVATGVAVSSPQPTVAALVNEAPEPIFDRFRPLARLRAVPRFAIVQAGWVGPKGLAAAFACCIHTASVSPIGQRYQFYTGGRRLT